MLVALFQAVFASDVSELLVKVEAVGVDPDVRFGLIVHDVFGHARKGSAGLVTPAPVPSEVGLLGWLLG